MKGVCVVAQTCPASTLLKGAHIESPDFREVKGLSPEQVIVARNRQSAKFDPEFFGEVRELKDTDEQTSLEHSESQFAV